MPQDEHQSQDELAATSAEPAEGSSAPAQLPDRNKRYADKAHGVLLTIAYDGSVFHGIARQQNARTVAGELDGAIRSLDPSASPVRICSRTDTGVHAKAQPVCFDTNQPIGSRGWLLGLTEHLPEQISIVRVEKVAPGFEPSHHAKGKVYRYVLLRSQARDPFWERRAWRLYTPLDLGLMQAAANQLLGRHDFAAFRGAQDERTDTVRTVIRAEFKPSSEDERLLYFEIEGDRFMYNMVRIIVGSLVDIGRGRLPPNAIQIAQASLNRRDLGMTAPPDGLYLDQVQLEVESWEAWPDSLIPNCRP